jgi:hypothetical protein
MPPPSPGRKPIRFGRREFLASSAVAAVAMALPGHPGDAAESGASTDEWNSGFGRDWFP